MPNTPDTIVRQLPLAELLARKSYFLFGPRQTGKSFLIRQQLRCAKNYNLLDYQTFFKLSRNPGLLKEELQAGEELIVIDEIQKLPVLLDAVHLLMEERGTRFLLTGSSARSLKRRGVNMLGGRGGDEKPRGVWAIFGSRGVVPWQHVELHQGRKRRPSRSIDIAGVFSNP